MRDLIDQRGHVVYTQQNGKHKHTVFQSTLSNGKDLCWERLRAQLYGEAAPVDTDASVCGTAVHAAIEHALNAVRAGDEPSWEEALQCIYDAVHAVEITAWTRYNSRNALILAAQEYFWAWWQGARERFRPVEVEWKFSLPLYEDDERIIVAEGTVDLVDQIAGLIDWKTSTREYRQAEKQKTAIQPTMYTWARTEYTGKMHATFSYYVMHSRGQGDAKVQQLSVTRTPNDWEHLKRIAVSYARLVEANLPTWPMDDTGWWCSDKWCPIYHRCKGHVTTVSHASA